ncbi:MAG: hypothetical protein ACJAZT_001119 [Gammaproteobacteria bacterium]|jgi:hypothetical protein
MILLKELYGGFSLPNQPLLRGQNSSDFNQGWQVIYAFKVEDFS